MGSFYVELMIKKGLTRLEDFALLCARQFGACISLRDEDGTKPAPESIEPDPYHEQQLKKAISRLREHESMTEEQARTVWRVTMAQRATAAQQNDASDDAQRAQVQPMLEKARAWDPPETYLELKKFMIEHLEWCMPLPRSSRLDTREPFVEWYAKMREHLARDVAYHEKSWEEEQQRAKERTAWLRGLRDALRGR